MMKRGGYRQLGLLAACAWLAGCASSTQTRPGVVHDAIQDEMKQALEARPAQSAPPPNLDLSLLPPLQTDGARPSPSQAVEGRFDLSVQNAPAAQVFMGIVSGTPYSMLVGPDITGNITINLKNVTVREALDSIRELYGYEYRIRGNRITIQPNTLQTRIFHFNYLVGRRIGSTDVRISSSSLASTGSSGSGTGAAGTTGTGTTGTGTPGTPGTSGTSGSSTGNAGSASVVTRTDNDFWTDVRQTLIAIVGAAEGRSVSLNPGAGIVVVRGFPADIRNVENYLKAAQLVIDREVMLEAKILDVELNETNQQGINWAVFGNGDNSKSMIGVAAGGSTVAALGSNASALSNGNVAAAVTGSALTGAAGAFKAANSAFTGLAFQTSNFAALLSFLETQGSVHVLSSPRVATLNNQKAVLKVGKDDYFVTAVSVSSLSSTSTSGTTTNTPVASYTTQVFFSGVALDVTPQIDDSESIVLHVHPAVSEVTATGLTLSPGAGIGNINLPSNKIKESDSIVRVQDGRIVAIGGLMDYSQTSDKSRLPGGGDNPLLGQRSGTYKKHELVILIKPTIIRHDTDWQSDLQGAQRRMSELGGSD